MKLKGMNYDIGTFTTKKISSRPVFDKKIVSREIEIIKNDLHCNAIRISGQDTERLIYASECAIKQGLDIWISPALHDATPKETLVYLQKCAFAAQKLNRGKSKIVFVVGCELTFFMKGLVIGESSTERMQTFMKPWRLIMSTIFKGSFNKNLNHFLKRATDIVRTNFKGEVTYASGVWESINWEIFDIVSVDYYFDSFTKRNYVNKLHQYKKIGKPLVITEFGCCTYIGAEEKGGYGWAIVDRTKIPPEIKGNYVRSEDTQVNILKNLIDIYEKAHITGGFVFTFVMPKYPYSDNPLFDLDIASYSIVKSCSKSRTSAYKDMPWEPKKSFFVLAKLFSKQ